MKAGSSAKAATQAGEDEDLNADATAKRSKGDERKAFMSTRRRSEPHPPSRAPCGGG
ncbi:PsiF family protein [Pseudomonas aeruginosa]